MPSTVNLAGIMSPQPPEDRTLAILSVEHNGETYEWQRYIDKSVTNLSDWVTQVTPSVLAEIDAKEQEWAVLSPKTKTIIDRFTREEVVVPLEKSEVVKPTIPDYYALRRNEYPALGDQLDAYWKGPNSVDFTAVQQKIAAVKQKYPKPQ